METLTATPASFDAFSIAALPPRTRRSATDTCFPPVSRSVEFLLNRVELVEHGLQPEQAGSPPNPSGAPGAGVRHWRRRACQSARKVEAEAHAAATSAETERPQARILSLSAAMS